MISTTSSPLGYSLDWRLDPNKPPSSKTATTKPASTSSSSQIADLQKQVQQLTALLTNPKNPLAGLSAGMLPPSSTVGLNPFGQNAQAWPMADMPQGGGPSWPPQGLPMTTSTPPPTTDVAISSPVNIGGLLA